MATTSSVALHPALLPPGAVIGDWCVEASVGCGSYGAVYRGVDLRHPLAAPVALKLALHPEDPRFAREAELLSRCLHPSIPRLLGQGSWRSPAGTLHPFLVMQWIDGVSLYEQARLHPLNSAQVRLWMAQLAQALAVLHAQGAIHRDLKGDNIRVRHSDGRAVLMDFGTGLYPGAAPLTPVMRFPGTSVYRSPESWLFEVQFYGSSTARYRPSPADDLYALGVTACRLLTGEYPELAAPFRDEHGTLHQGGVRLPLSLMRSPYVEASVRSFILRLLSVNLEERGTAAQLAEDLEQTLRPFRPSNSRDASAPSWSCARSRTSWIWGAPAAACMAVAVWAWWTGHREVLKEHSASQASAKTAGLGDAATASASETAPSGSTEEAMSENSLPEPVPGQARPDEKGRCPGKGLVSLNGACWAEATWEPETCLTLGGQVFKGTCYVPFIPPGRKRPPTSGTMQTP